MKRKALTTYLNCSRLSYVSLHNAKPKQYIKQDCFQFSLCDIMKFPVVIFMCFLFGNINALWAQKQNNQWRFGSNAGMDFNVNPPSYVGGSAIQVSEGCASVADRNTGRLLFYTDGVRVWDSTNTIMPNGSGLLGGSPVLLSSTTAAIIVPKPGSSHLYYIVTIDEGSSGQSNQGLRYSLVDMKLNGGKGDVVATQKNILLLTTNTERAEVIPAANCNEFWVVTNRIPSDSFFAFRLTAAGFQPKPVVSLVGAGHGAGSGHLKVNRQFNKLVCCNFFDQSIEMYNFNNATGVLSNSISWKLAVSGLAYGFEFSPNGKFLFTSDLVSGVYQYDVSLPTASAIKASEYVVTKKAAASLQLGPDGKIYTLVGGLDAIANPDQPGPACDYRESVIANQRGGGGYGLPKWVYSPVVNGLKISFSGDSCAGQNISFSATASSAIKSISWNFDDPSSGAANQSTSVSPGHKFSGPGTYNVRCVAKFDCGEDTVFQKINIKNCDSTREVLELLLANVFTPGADGKNDLWEIYYKGWDKVDVQIYSRWGVNVASYSLPAEKSWNGRLMNTGVLLPEGTYFYQLLASDTQTLSTKRVSGIINLIR